MDSKRYSEPIATDDRQDKTRKDLSISPIHPPSPNAPPDTPTMDEQPSPIDNPETYRCTDCGHIHASANLGRICIGCPCLTPQPLTNVITTFAAAVPIGEFLGGSPIGGGNPGVVVVSGPRPEAGDLSGWLRHPHRLAVDGKGYVWRAYIGDPDDPMASCWSMAPVNPDNSPIPTPVTFYEPVFVAESNPFVVNDCTKLSTR